TWNDLDAVSDETRSVIFKNIADGVSKLNAVAGWTPEMLHKFMLGMYPEITDENYEEFKKGLGEMAEHKQFTDASYTEALDYNKGNSDTDNDLPDPDNPNNVEIVE
ncbi:MAG TPA: hypothetical protein VMW95_04010, partial [Desulfobacterales bacterium]|nr:hypothetical protein [Desulfobacterales bacterium]